MRDLEILPMINVRDNFKSLCLPMHFYKIIIHPLNNVVLERPFNYLVKEIGR